MKKAIKRYRSFHGKDIDSIVDIDFTVPKQLVLLGEAVAVEYRCDKYNGGGDGKMAVYRHKFETPTMLCMDESGKRQLYLIGSRIAVTNRGIVR